MYFDLVSGYLPDLPVEAPFTIRCHPSRVSDVVGQGRANVKCWRQPETLVTVRPDVSLMQYEVAVVCRRQSFKGSILTDLHYDIYEV
jgi:hypothetical protein